MIKLFFFQCSCEDNAARGRQQRLYSCEMRGKPLGRRQCSHQLNQPQNVRDCWCWHVEHWDSKVSF